MFNKKKIADNKGTAIWVDAVGSITPRIFTILGNPKDKQVVLDFGDEKIKVNTTYIRKKRILIYCLTDGKKIVQNPDKWKDIPLKKYNIKELKFNLQNFGIQERRSALSRWTLPPDRITQLAPWFKLLIIGLVIGVLGWFTLKFGGYTLDAVTKARFMDCAQLLPQSVVPIEINATQPIG